MKLPIIIIIILLLCIPCLKAGATDKNAIQSIAPGFSQGMNKDTIVALYHAQLSLNTAFPARERVSYIPDDVSFDDVVAAYIHRKFATLNDTVSLPGYFMNKRYVFNNEERALFKAHISTDLRPKYKNKDAQRLFELMEITHCKGYGDYFESKIDSFEHFLRKARRWNDPPLEAYTLYLMWSESYHSVQYARSFRYARQLEEVLDGIDVADYPQKSDDYHQLGRAYYHFKDYDEATRLMHKSVAIAPHLRAWNYLATMHDMNGRLDSAAYYHQAILHSNETWKEDPIHLAIAISNLGRIEMQRGNYDDALVLLQTGLGGVIDRWDHSFRSGIHISLAECYFEKGDTAAVRREIAAAQADIDCIEEQFKPLRRIAKLHALRSRYHQYLGQHRLAKVHQDSALYVSSRYEQETSRHIIILGEQQAAEQLKDQEIAGQRNIIIGTVAALVLISAALVIIIRLYRRRDAAYRVLAERAKLWAQIDPSVSASAATSPQRGEELWPVGLSEDSSPQENPIDCPWLQPGDEKHAANPCLKAGATDKMEDDLHILSLADLEMTQHHAYREIGLSLDTLADRLGVSRNAFSGAINRVTGGNFNQYINSYRIKEAVRIISVTDRSNLYIDELSELVGFNNRVTFYRAFKQFTGLSPLEFQKRSAQDRRS